MPFLINAIYNPAVNPFTIERAWEIKPAESGYANCRISTFWLIRIINFGGFTSMTIATFLQKNINNIHAHMILGILKSQNQFQLLQNLINATTSLVFLKFTLLVLR
jgi:hypothetical protein